MAHKTHGYSNVPPDAPGGISLDSMDSFDSLPKVLRQFLANSITPWNSIEACKLAAFEGVDKTLRLLRQAEQNQHNAAVRVGVIPKVESFVFHPRQESPINAKRRQRIEDAGERRLRAIRKRYSAGRL